MGRVREDTTGIETVTNIYTGSSGAQYQANIDVVREISTCEDVVTPYYRSIVRKGGVVNNPCTITGHKISWGGTYTVKDYTYDGVNYDYIGSQDGGDDIALLFYSLGSFDSADQFPIHGTDMRIASAKLTALANIDSTPYAFGEDLLELKKTFKYLSEIKGRLRRITKDFKKRLKKLYESDYDKVKKIDDAWLEYRFAISPLVRSVQDLLEAFTTTAITRPARMTSRGFATNSTITRSPNVTVNSLTSYETVKYDEEIRAGIYYTHLNPLQGWRFKFGLRNKDIPTTLWQVVPLSFMIDRVWNITNSLKGLINLGDPSIQILAAWCTVKTETDTRSDVLSCVDTYFTNGTKPVQYDRTAGNMFYKKHSFKYERSVWHPSASDLIPPTTWANLVKDATSMMDLFALVESLLRDKLK